MDDNRSVCSIEEQRIDEAVLKPVTGFPRVRWGVEKIEFTHGEDSENRAFDCDRIECARSQSKASQFSTMISNVHGFCPASHQSFVSSCAQLPRLNWNWHQPKTIKVGYFYSINDTYGTRRHIESTYAKSSMLAWCSWTLWFCRICLWKNVSYSLRDRTSVTRSNFTLSVNLSVTSTMIPSPP